MTKLGKIMLIIWGVLALLSFVSAFWAPLYFKIIGIAFGALNVMILLTLVISYFQGLYYSNKLNKELEDVQLQTLQETPEEKTGGE